MSYRFFKDREKTLKKVDLETLTKQDTLTKLEKRLKQCRARYSYKDSNTARDKTLTKIEHETLTKLKTLTKLEKRLNQSQRKYFNNDRDRYSYKDSNKDR